MYLLRLSVVSDIMFLIHRFETCVVASAGTNCKRLADIWTGFIHKLNFWIMCVFQELKVCFDLNHSITLTFAQSLIASWTCSTYNFYRIWNPLHSVKDVSSKGCNELHIHCVGEGKLPFLMQTANRLSYCNAAINCSVFIGERRGSVSAEITETLWWSNQLVCVRTGVIRWIIGTTHLMWHQLF